MLYTDGVDVGGDVDGGGIFIVDINVQSELSVRSVLVPDDLLLRVMAGDKNYRLFVWHAV